MTDRKLLEEVHYALRAMLAHGEDHAAESRAATTLARVEAALAETEEEKVERVAQAICKATYYDVEPDMYESEEAFFTKDGPDAWKHFGDSDFMHQARAAIAAMGE